MPVVPNGTPLSVRMAPGSPSSRKRRSKMGRTARATGGQDERRESHGHRGPRSLGSAFYDPGPLDDPVLGRCAWSGRVTGRFVYQEQHLIRAYFEAADPAAYPRAIPPAFAVPERPLVRVTVLDFYAMASGPPYRESEVSVLALPEGEPGWGVLTMPGTGGDSCGGGRGAWG